MDLDDDDYDKPFSQVLEDLMHPQNRRDPRTHRLAAVAQTMAEVTGSAKESTAAQIYAKSMAALEGALQSKEAVTESLNMQVALMQLLAATASFVSPPTILQATFPLASRVIRAVIATSQALAAEGVMETKDGLGGVQVPLQWACRLSGELLKYIPNATEAKLVKQFLLGTLMALFNDSRPRVRKAAHSSLLGVLVSTHSGSSVASSPSSVEKLVSSYAHNGLSKAIAKPKPEVIEQTQPLVHFLEQSILYLNFEQLGADTMELLVVLMRQEDSTTDFVAYSKVRDATPKIMVIGGLLSIVKTMLEDESRPQQTFLNEFASRVLATLLQTKPKMIFRQGVAESDVLQRCVIQLGQTALGALVRITDDNTAVASKLLPLTVQLVVQLSCPGEENLSESDVGGALLVNLTEFYRTEMTRIVSLQDKKCLTDTLLQMELVLHPSFVSIYNIGLKCLVILMKSIKPVISVQTTVDKLVALHADLPTASTSRASVEDSFVALVQEIGLEDTWAALAFEKLSPREGIPVEQAWLLAALKSGSSASQPEPLSLSFFQTRVLNLARKEDRLAASMKSSGQLHRARVIDLWSLFPCFCRQTPKDMEATLPSLTSTLTKVLQDKRYPELLSAVCGGIQLLAQGQAEKQRIGLLAPGSDKDYSALQSVTTQLLPCLFKIVSESSSVSGKQGQPMEVVTDSSESDRYGQDTAPIIDCIATLAKVAPDVLVHGMFQKLMHKLLEHIQAEDSNSKKICSLLNLSEALVVSEALAETNIAFLYRALKPLIRNDQCGAAVQKKAYKVLAEICRNHRSFILNIDRLRELITLLTGTTVTSQVAARYMRLKCLNIIVSRLTDDQHEAMRELSDILGELLLCLKDTNTKTREAAFQLLLTMFEKSSPIEFTQAIMAALGAETPHMRSAAVTALSRIVFQYGKQFSDFDDMLPSMLKTVLVLINEDSREVIKSVLGFVRICVAMIQPENLTPLLPEIVCGLTTYQKKKDRFRAKVKIILKKLVKIYGFNSLMPYVPASEKRLLTHMRKLEERHKRRKDAHRETNNPRNEKFEDMLESDENDSDDGKTFISGATGLSRFPSRQGKTRSANSSKSTVTGRSGPTLRRTETSFCLPDTHADGDVVDILGTNIARKVHFAEDANDSDSNDGGNFEIDQSGRLIIPNEEDSEHHNDEEISHGQRSNKRRRIQTTSSKTSSTNKSLGSAYKSKKAGGDVKKKGQKYEPYAFMPLNGRSYTKKNRKNAVEQMATVVRGREKRKRGRK